MFIEYVIQYLIDRNLRRAFVQHLCISLFTGKVIYFCVYASYPLLIEFALASEDCVAACREQNVVVKRWDKYFATPLEELWAEVYA